MMHYIVQLFPVEILKLEFVSSGFLTSNHIINMDMKVTEI